VKESVIPSGGPGGKIALFDEDGRNPAEGKIPGDAHAGGSSPDDEDLCLKVQCFSCLRSENSVVDFLRG
jgi:hypothetical protein